MAEENLGRDTKHLSSVCSDTGINRPTVWAAQTVMCGSWHLELTVNLIDLESYAMALPYTAG